MGPSRGPAGNKKPRGKMTPYACFVKVIRAEHKKKHPNEHIVFAEFSKKCAEKWAKMTDKEKKRFQDLSAEDKVRYDNEMASYVPPPDDIGGVKRRKKKRTKDPNAPKRALSAFMWFCKDERPKVKDAQPELRMGDIAKILSEQWKVCPKKSYYEQKADADKKRYAEEMVAYRSGGTFGASGSSIPKASNDDDMESEEESGSGSGEDEDETNE